MRTRRLVIVVLLCTVPVGLWLLLRMTPPGYTRIDLTEEGKGHNLLSAVLPDGEQVILTWRNSQFGLDVTETFFTRRRGPGPGSSHLRRSGRYAPPARLRQGRG